MDSLYIVKILCDDRTIVDMQSSCVAPIAFDRTCQKYEENDFLLIFGIFAPSGVFICLSNVMLSYIYIFFDTKLVRLKLRVAIEGKSMFILHGG